MVESIWRNNIIRQGLYWFPLHAASWIISTSPGWDPNRLQVTLGIEFSTHWGGEKLCRIKLHSPVCNTMILVLVRTIILHWLSKWENGAQNIH